NWPVKVLLALIARVPPPTLVRSPGPPTAPVFCASVPPSTPIEAAEFRVIAPVTVTAPNTFSRAPLPPTPPPLGTGGGAPVPVDAPAFCAWGVAPPATATLLLVPTAVLLWAFRMPPATVVWPV